MIASISVTQPFATAVRQKVLGLMDVILHIGAHRCATTSFQYYMRSNADRLSAQRIGFWGPMRTRAGLFRGILPGPEVSLNRDIKRRALGRVQLQCAKSVELGVEKLVISDENMLGSMRVNMRFATLYSGAGERLARFGEAFGAYLSDVVINIRSPELYWASAFGFFAQNGRGVPHPGLLDRISQVQRTWRDVITDVACAVPQARLHVMPFEQFAGRPDAQLAHLTGQTAPRHFARDAYNQTPDLTALRQIMQPGEGDLPDGEGRWMPFTDPQRAMLRETYADDLMWLVAGADGLATLVQDPAQDTLAPSPAHNKAEKHPPQSDMTRGQNDDSRHRQVARPGRERAARKTG